MILYYLLPVLAFLLYPVLKMEILTFINLCLLPVYIGLISGKVAKNHLPFNKAVFYVWVVIILGVGYIVEYIFYGISNNGLYILDFKTIHMFCVNYKISLCIATCTFLFIKGFTKQNITVLTIILGVYSSLSIITWYLPSGNLKEIIELFLCLNDYSILYLFVSIITIIWCLFAKDYKNKFIVISFVTNILNIILWLSVIL